MNSTEKLSEHYCQTRASLLPSILQAIFHMNAILNIGIPEDVFFYVVFFCFVFLFYLPWIVTRTSPLNRIPSKSFYVLSDTRLSSYIFDYFLMWSSWRLSTSNFNYWRPPLIPIATISRAVTKINRIFSNLRFISWHAISRIYFPWSVISKKYSSWTVMRSLSPTHLYVSVKVCKQTTPETCTRVTVMDVCTRRIWYVINLGVMLWLAYFRSLSICKILIVMLSTW